MIDQNTFEAMAKANRFAVHNGIVIRQLEMGKAEAVLEMGPNCLNPYGRLHGGALYSLADCAGGTACRTDGRHYVTLDGSLHFIHSADHGTITALATVIHRGRTTAAVDVRITDQDGTLLAAGTFSFFCVDKK